MKRVICNLREMRETMELSLVRTSQLMGMPESTYSYIEKGLAIPNPDRTERICKFFSRTADEIWPKDQRGEYIPAQPLAKKARRGHILPYQEPPSSAISYANLRRSANVRLGDRFRRRIGAAMGDGIWDNCTVVKRYNFFFRVVYDKTGASECFTYHALINDNELRRI